jgi:hypothetical protein
LINDHNVYHVNHQAVVISSCPLQCIRANARSQGKENQIPAADLSISQTHKITGYVFCKLLGNKYDHKIHVPLEVEGAGVR